MLFAVLRVPGSAAKGAAAGGGAGSHRVVKLPSAQTCAVARTAALGDRPHPTLRFTSTLRK